MRTGLPGAVAFAILGVGASVWPAAAQKASPSEPATTVEPLVARPLAPVPQVGEGAPYFTHDELAGVTAQAKADEASARRVVGSNPSREALGDFGIPCVPGRRSCPKPWRSPLVALCATVRDRERVLFEAAEAADAATRAAVSARERAASQQDLVDTELTRQTAVRAYMTARTAAAEADYRVSDFTEMLRHSINGVFEVNTYYEVEKRTRERAANGGQELKPEEFADLWLRDVTWKEDANGGSQGFIVEGTVVNTRQRKIKVPPLEVFAIDRMGLRLTARVVEAPGKSIEPGASFHFHYLFKPAPDQAKSVRVNFANTLVRPSVLAVQSCGDAARR